MIALLVKEFKIHALKSTKIITFSIILLNVDSSVIIENRLLKFPVVIIDMLMEEISQILYIGPSLCFMWLQKWCLQILENVSRCLT